MKKYINGLVVLTIVGALVGCARTAPIEQVHSSVSTGYTQGQVKNAILKAGIQRQWIMSEVSPGVIKARLQTRDHEAEVRIIYTATKYEIRYVNSLNLQASGGEIHKNYNRWVRNLDKDIQINLSEGANL